MSTRTRRKSSLRRRRTQATTRLLLISAAAGAALLNGQTLAVYSEFQRVDPFGNIVAADRGGTPREILSPAAPRNGFVSFHVAVTAPAGTNYFLYVVPAPLNACRVALYKEHFTRTPTGWIPDALEPITRLPQFATMPDPA